MRSRTMRVVTSVLAAVAAVAIVLAAATEQPASAAGESISVTPNQFLANGQTVTVNGTGIGTDGDYVLFQCYLTTQCSSLGGSFFVSGGSFSRNVQVSTLVNGNSCTSSCSIRLRPNGGNDLAFATISFGTAPTTVPPTTTTTVLIPTATIQVTPTSGLTNNANVSVDGSGFPTNVRFRLSQCIALFCDSTINDYFELLSGTSFTEYPIQVKDTINGTLCGSTNCFIRATRDDNGNALSNDVTISFGGGTTTTTFVPTPNLAVNPEVMQDGQVVEVLGDGFPVETGYHLEQCHFANGCTVVSENLQTDSDGFVHTAFVARETVGGGSCLDVNACTLRAVYGGGDYAEVGLDFLAADRTVSLSKSANLSDGEVISVSASGWQANSPHFVAQCVLDEELRCDESTFVGETTDGDGGFTTDFAVKYTLSVPLAGGIICDTDCNDDIVCDPTTNCVVVVSDDEGDRRIAKPISFSTGGTTTSTSTTTTSTSTTTTTSTTLPPTTTTTEPPTTTTLPPTTTTTEPPTTTTLPPTTTTTVPPTTTTLPPTTTTTVPPTTTTLPPTTTTTVPPTTTTLAPTTTTVPPTTTTTIVLTPRQQAKCRILSTQRASIIVRNEKAIARARTEQQRQTLIASTQRSLATNEKAMLLNGCPAPAPWTPPVAAGVTAAQSYTVQPGDNLFQIAQRLLGDGNRYNDLFRANNSQIARPGLIHPGQVLVIPQFPVIS